MKASGKTFFAVCFALFLCAASLVQAQDTPRYAYDEDLVYGLEAYKNKDWSNALFFLRKASGVKESSSEEVWLLMILTEMHVSDYYAVLRDADVFSRRFPSSRYIPHIEYQIQLARFGLGLYEESAEGFSAFAATYSEHPLLPSALFWAGESLYRQYEYARSLPLYKRVVDEYPESSKYAESVYRIELLKQREREEKLLYLLRVTGEEAASAREDYERQVKLLQGEEALSLKRNVQKLEEKLAALQTSYEESRQQNEALNTRVNELISENAQLTSEALKASEALQTTQAAQDARKEAAQNASESAQQKSLSEQDKMLIELKKKAKELEKLLGAQGDL